MFTVRDYIILLSLAIILPPVLGSIVTLPTIAMERSSAILSLEITLAYVSLVPLSFKIGAPSSRDMTDFISTKTSTITRVVLFMSKFMDPRSHFVSRFIFDLSNGAFTLGMINMSLKATLLPSVLARRVLPAAPTLSAFVMAFLRAPPTITMEIISLLCSADPSPPSEPMAMPRTSAATVSLSTVSRMESPMCTPTKAAFMVTDYIIRPSLASASRSIAIFIPLVVSGSSAKESFYSAALGIVMSAGTALLTSCTLAIARPTTMGIADPMSRVITHLPRLMSGALPPVSRFARYLDLANIATTWD